jgi:hypothetical protein
MDQVTISAARSYAALRREEQARRSTKRLIVRLLITSVVILCALGLAPAVVWINSSSRKIDELGVFGDSFGAVNSLFTGLAYAAAISAFVLQRQDSLLAIENQERGRAESTDARLFTAEVEARSALAIVLAIRTAGLSNDEAAARVKASDDAINELEASIKKVSDLRLANAIGRAIFEGDEVASRMYPDPTSKRG